jgi:hypothetical protein
MLSVMNQRDPVVVRGAYRSEGPDRGDSRAGICDVGFGDGNGPFLVGSGVMP